MYGNGLASAELLRKQENNFYFLWAIKWEMGVTIPPLNIMSFDI